MSKESFKIFARNHNELANVVLSGKATWQQLYELYEIYGENNSIWNNYINTNNTEITKSFKELLNTIKNIDADTVQKGINNIEKVIGLIQDIGLNNRNNYETEPIYKRFN